MVYFRLKHNMPMEQLIDMFLENNYQNLYINGLKPQDERRWIVTFLNIIQKKHFEDFNEKESIFFKIVQAIDKFNDTCKCYKNKINVEKLTIRDYPWLMDAVFEILRSEKHSENNNNNNNIENNMHRLLQSHEPELYHRWFPPSEDITFASLTLVLKSNLQNKQENWEKYLDVSKKNHHLKQVHHFIRSMRWYKDLPIKFAERCRMDCVYEKHKVKISSSITILAILLHGETVTKLIDFFAFTEMKIDTSCPNAKDNYKMMKNLALSMRLSNPPIRLDLIIRLCVGDYLPIALMILMSVSKRTPMPKVISCAQKLTNMCVSVQKHGIRLMSLIYSMKQLLNFYQEILLTANHYSI